MNLWLRTIQKNKFNNYCPNISMEIIFMITENIKTNEPYKIVVNLHMD